MSLSRRFGDINQNIHTLKLEHPRKQNDDYSQDIFGTRFHAKQSNECTLTIYFDNADNNDNKSLDNNVYK